MKLLSGKKETANGEGNKTIAHHAILPIIAITFFFGYWFSHYSYDKTFYDFYQIFTPELFQKDYSRAFNWVYPISILCLALIIYPAKDSSPKKWNLLIFLTFVIFFLKYKGVFPYIANHSMMMVLLTLGYFIIIGAYILKGKASQIFIQMDYLGLMRMFLIIMYFFGTFHKINSGFLHDDGCWRLFYDTIPMLPEFMKHGGIAIPLGGYGTLVLEAVAMVMLFFPKTKYYGMLLGMSFHFIIGVSGTGTVAHFSGFAFALHMSFLSTDAIPKFTHSKLWRWLNKAGRGHINIRIPFILFLMACITLSYTFNHSYDGDLKLYDYLPFLQNIPSIHLIYIKTTWVLYSIPVLAFVLLYGRSPQKRTAPFLTSPIWTANIVSLLLLFNSITPYIGLKSSTDLAMFSNLRTEWGESNHYLIPKLPYIFPYLKKEYYIQITDAYDLKKVIRNSNYRNENSWVHIFWLQRFAYDKRKHISDEELRNMPKDKLASYWVEYKDHKGKTYRIDGTNYDNFFLQKPAWINRNYLEFVKLVDNAPHFCSSR